MSGLFFGAGPEGTGRSDDGFFGGDGAAAPRAVQRGHAMLEELGGPADELTTMLERRLTDS